MTHPPLHTRLESLGFLDSSDFEHLDTLLRHRETSAAGSQLVVEAQKVEQTRVIVEGWAFRYRSLRDGSRQILNVLIPGDIFGFFAVMIDRSDCGVQALTPMKFSQFPVTKLVETLVAAPRLILALSWIAGQSERILNEQITRIGRRNSKTRMAHLLVELYVRLRKSGLEHSQACRLPVTQTLLADALGMSAVHANRSFRSLARDRLVDREHGHIQVLDAEALARVADFDHTYLDYGKIPAPTRKAVEAKLG